MTTTLIGHPEPAPHLSDSAAERRLLGAVLRYPSIGDHALATTTATAFTNDRHRAIFQAAAAVRGRGQPCDTTHVEAELSRHSRAPADSVTVDELHELAAHALPEPVAIYYLAIVRDLAALRSKPSSADPDTYRAQGNVPEGIPPMPMRGFLTDDD